MKFLIALSILASSSVFANEFSSHYIKCYEAPQQTDTQKVAYKFKSYGEDIKLVYPERIRLGVEVSDTETPDQSWQCLSSIESGKAFRACRTEGQSINLRIPVEINEEETVYCDPSILDWISGYPN